MVNCNLQLKELKSDVPPMVTLSIIVIGSGDVIVVPNHWLEVRLKCIGIHVFADAIAPVIDSTCTSAYA